MRVTRQALAGEGREEPVCAVQLFSDEYLERCRRLSPDEIVCFLEEFRRNFAAAKAAREAAANRQPDTVQDAGCSASTARNASP